MPRRRRPRILRTLIVGLLSLLMSFSLAGVVQAAPARPSAQPDRWDAVRIGTPELQNCFDRAKARGVVAWTCTSDGLTVVDQRTKVKSFTAVRANAVAGSTDTARRLEPDPDTWCEYVSTCTSRYSRYIAWAKGNLAYGDSNGAIGTWDNTYRVNFSGRQPRYSIVAVHDTGPKVYIDLYLKCNETPWPYSECGYSTRYFAISSTARTYKSGLIYGNRLEDVTSYRATDGGTFDADGHWQIFGIPALRSLTWNCSTTECYFP
jgi:hypothetical protein